MSLLQYWPSANEINDCIKHEAEGAHDAVLLAVHRPTPLSYKQVSSGERFDASEEELFQLLVSRDVPSGALVIPITGASGVGKSHMVRILNARLRSSNEDGRYVVIRIPKSASLRKVVNLILDELPEEYAQVRAEFAKALTEDLDVETAVIRFQRELDISLGQLAKALEARVRANPRDSALKEQWGHATALPKFMGDPVLVDHFREKVFSRFVRRAIAGQNLAEQEELVKDFVPEDLLLPESIDISKSAFQTNAYYTRNLLVREGEGMRVATRLLNDNTIIDQAIRQLFSLHQALGGMTLQDVILEIRRRLLAEGRELVIFVEDFKALTGIQDILLKVLIQEGVRDGVQELATMRSVIAVTDGYLDTEDTIATRAKFEWKVESELSSPEEVLKRTKALVAAYLNAARWGFRELIRHSEKNRDAGSHSRWIGPYVDPDGSGDFSVLAAFGYQDEIPLFPYTEPAIEQLAKVALTRNNALVFTPRFVIDGVLRSLLLQGRPAFERGEFPPPSIKAPGTNAEVAEWLGLLPVSVEIRERYRRIVSIWGNAPRTVAEVGYIPKEVFDAFKLDRPDVKFQKAPSREAKADPIQKQPVPQPKPDDELLKVTLEKWANGERMPQPVANLIRKSVAAALNDRIDWSAERCAKAPIQANQISIPHAGGEAGKSEISSIKIAEDHTDQSGQLRLELAAVTRLYHQNAGKIGYIDADDDLVWVGNLADRLMVQTLSFVRAGTRQKLGAALWLLQTNSQILGLAKRGMTPARIAPFLFGEVNLPVGVPAEAKTAFIEWRVLQEQALRIRPELIQIATSFCGSFQGTTGRTAYAIDIIRITDLLQADGGTQGAGILEIPSELKPLLATMTEARVNAQARKVLLEANAIRARLVAELGESFNKQEIVDELKALAEQLGGSGVWPAQDIGMATTAFKKRCDEFGAAAIREALTTLSNAGEEGPEQGHVLQIGRVGRLDVNPLVVADNFAETARKVIRASERQASAMEAQFEGVDPQAQASGIQELFHSLINELDSFAAEGGAP